MRRARNISPPYMTPLNNVTVHSLGPECLGAELKAIDAGIASTVWTSSLLIFVPLLLTESLIVSRFFWCNATAVDGNTDVGIYSEDGAIKLASSGVTLNAGTDTVQSVDITDVMLPANQRMWLALGSESAVQGYYVMNPLISALDFIGVKQQAAGWSSGLPSTVAVATPTVAKLPLYGFTGASVI